MMTGPAVGPAMLLTVLMRWPSLIVLGAASVGGTLIYREVDDRYDLTHQIQAIYKKPKAKMNHEHPLHGEVILTRAASSPAVIATYPQHTPLPVVEQAQPTPLPEPVKKPVDPEPEPTKVAAALAIDDTATAAPGGKVYVVQKGDSLTKIVTKLGIPSPKRHDAMLNMLMENPRAFLNMDPDRLNEGTVLNIPQMASK